MLLRLLMFLLRFAVVCRDKGILKHCKISGSRGRIEDLEIWQLMLQKQMGN